MNHPEGGDFAIIIGSVYIILAIAQLITKEIINSTLNIDFKMTLLLVLITCTVATVSYTGITDRELP